MSAPEDLLKRLPNDIGGLPAEPIVKMEHELEPWEKRCHALADVLDFHKIINTEEKRRGVEALGAEMVGKITYYERWIAAFANILFQKVILTPEVLALKMDEVAARWPEEPMAEDEGGRTPMRVDASGDATRCGRALFRVGPQIFAPHTPGRWP